MKRIARNALALGMCGVLAAGTVGIAAMPKPAFSASGAGTSEQSSGTEPEISAADAGKQQVVYVKENADGTQSGVYVVNMFDPRSSGKIVDQGSYEAVTNLTDSQELDCVDGSVSFRASSDESFRYQGDLDPSAETPWKVGVSYRLNGAEVDSGELEGADGKVEMVLTIAPNENCSGGYAENYLVQVTGALGADVASGIVADGATFAQAGDSTQLTYMLFPGKSAEYVISFDARDFEFDGFQMVGVPLSMALDMDDEDLDLASGGLGELSDAVARLNDGTGDMVSGIGSLGDGAAELAASNSSLSEGAASVAEALDGVQEGAQRLSDSIDEQLVPGVQQLADGSSSYAGQLDQSVAALEQQTQGVTSDQAMAVYDQALQQFSTNPADPSAQEALRNAQSLVTAAYVEEALETARTGYSRIDAGIQGMADESSSESVYGLSVAARSLADGTAATGSGYEELRSGIDGYMDGVLDLKDGCDELGSGGSELSDGVRELFDQTRDLDRKLVESIRDELEEYLNPQFQAPDFVNASSLTNRVQFVYRTAGVN